MDDKSLKDSFKKIRQDMTYLAQEILFLKEKILEITGNFEKNASFGSKENSTNKPEKPTISTHLSTHDLPFKALNSQNLGISTRNEGVSTDRQTDRQTDNPPISNAKKIIFTQINEKITPIDRAAEILSSLDSLRKEIRLQFKRLTSQEMAIFSAIYELEERYGYVDYKTIAERLNITESSIRDHVGKIIKKGIPLDKKRIDNRKIQLSIPLRLKKLTNLETIYQLRDI